MPERTRLCRLFRTHRAWPASCLAAPTLLGVIDTDGLAWIHPRREGRSPHPSGRQGLANPRWIGGGTLGLGVNRCGWVVAWDGAPAHVQATTVQPRVRQVADHRRVWSDTAFPAAAGDPTNLNGGQRGEWTDRLLMETGRSRLPVICPFKKVMHRGWAYVQARLACTMAAFNRLVPWHGLPAEVDGFVPLSIAEVSL